MRTTRSNGIPSGVIGTLASKGSKLIRTPLTNPMNQRWNRLVNEFISTGNAHGIELLSKQDHNKVFNMQYNIGKCRYVVNFHDGLKVHNDGSKFFDIAIFRNKRDLNIFLAELRNKGYIESRF